MKVLVCGGRNYDARTVLYGVLDGIHRADGIDAVITGMARGADMLAHDWAVEQGIAVNPFPADWKTHSRAAGPIRNQHMIDQGKPDLVVAFPGGRGTADMVRRAETAGIKTILVV